MSRSFGHGPLDFNLMSPVIRGLMAANVALFLLGRLVGPQFTDLFGLVPAHVFADRWLWQLGSYLFLHGSFIHLLFNLFALWMFGMAIESQWGGREFLKYYLLCGMGAGVLNVLLAPHSPIPIIGASGAIYGLLVAFAMLYPDSVVYIYFFFPMKAKHMALLFGLLEFFSGVTQATPGVARFAHLGGMVIGYLYLRWWWVLKLRLKSGLRAERRAAPAPRRVRRVPEADMEQVDRILDKILSEGEGALTEEERQILKRYKPRNPNEPR